MMRAYNRVPDLRLGVKGQRAPREGFSEEVPYKLKIEENSLKDSHAGTTEVNRTKCAKAL